MAATLAQNHDNVMYVNKAISAPWFPCRGLLLFKLLSHFLLAPEKKYKYQRQPVGVLSSVHTSTQTRIGVGWTTGQPKCFSKRKKPVYDGEWRLLPAAVRGGRRRAAAAVGLFAWPAVVWIDHPSAARFPQFAMSSAGRSNEISATGESPELALMAASRWVITNVYTLTFLLLLLRFLLPFYINMQLFTEIISTSFLRIAPLLNSSWAIVEHQNEKLKMAILNMTTSGSTNTTTTPTSTGTLRRWIRGRSNDDRKKKNGNQTKNGDERV